MGGCSEQKQSQPQQTIAFKKATKEIANEEDRCKNLVVFGLAEEEGEDLENKLCSVSQAQKHTSFYRFKKLQSQAMISSLLQSQQIPNILNFECMCMLCHRNTAAVTMNS